jgi:putative glutamine amidotransferase
MSRPVVGICAAIEQARWAAWELEVNLLPRTYTRELAAAGATALLLPPADADVEAPDELLGRLDALILAGGADIDPASYGATADEHTTNFRPERDRFELALARAAIDRGLPLLGICRGMEVLNVARGGTLEQHLPTAEVHLHTPGTYSDHEVRLEPGSLAAQAVGAERVSVRSHHHQGIGELGTGLVASGHSEPDGVVEAIELPEHPFALGALWHAEEEQGSSVIGALVAATSVEVA